MKVGVILLTCGRADLTQRVVDRCLFNSGHNAPVYWVDNGSGYDDFMRIAALYPFDGSYRFEENKGISAAINAGIRMAKTEGCDAVVTLANDIMMPDGWLAAMVSAAGAIERTGMVGIHCVETLPPIEELDGVTVHPTFAPFGNTLITMEAIRAVGMFNEDFDPYGMQDTDFGYRTTMAGFRNYYLPHLQSEHIGHDVGQDSEYRRMKDEGLSKAGQIWADAQSRYDETGNYTIFYPEW